MKPQVTIDQARSWMGVIALGVMVLAGIWIHQIIHRQGDEAAGRLQNRKEPDYYVEKFNFIKLSNNGQANYHVQGDKLIHLPQTDQYEITNPLIHSFDERRQPVTIQAKRALVEQKSANPALNRSYDQVHFYEDVVVAQTSADPKNFFQLNTQYLLMLPDTDIVKTDQAVRMQTYKVDATSIGIEANNLTQQVSFLSKVNMRIKRRPDLAAPPSQSDIRK
ncbi:LPS export ABC transporter periplasmic protein LptC [Undibacterium sp. CY7W]|uniref:LPS export ABC transporter periplasmic protein LptC n=1 Tax=Undibacterium rugosum TaxID=2762291 RepID=A0A923KUK9_9BURK|nr:LPS export ABC transporter periplasmic protein LptC [Undibacterium rugosum]MBC3937204.1 LPS export ABC transporter periplasmic protein LptC [Undibacterium rugosum]